MKEAMFYKRSIDNKVNCFLCNHRCIINDGKRGICGVRENNNGTLYSLVYGKAIASHIDPIEKKPLNHFLPGSLSYSIATVGCNFRCMFCQNWDISQRPKEYGRIEGKSLSPDEIVENALMGKCNSISYTYTEPTIFFEYAYDTGKLARRRGLRNVFVTNGFMTEDAIDIVKRFLDAANIDLKAFTERFYRDMCGAHLEPVLRSIKKMKKLGIWIEITTLIIPKVNDSDDELKGIAEFIANEVGIDTPWHVSRFHPDYKYTDSYSTPIETLHRAKKIGVESGLRYIYVGNVPGDHNENTYCPECGELLIERSLFYVSKNKIKNDRCPKCNAKIGGIWK